MLQCLLLLSSIKFLKERIVDNVVVCNSMIQLLIAVADHVKQTNSR